MTSTLSAASVACLLSVTDGQAAVLAGVITTVGALTSAALSSLCTARTLTEVIVASSGIVVSGLFA